MTDTAPGQAPARERGVPTSFYLAPSGQMERGLSPRRLVEALKEGGQLWLDVDATDRSQHALLEKVFGFHHLAIEDTLSPKTRVKLEEYPGYLFLVVREVRFDHKTDDPYDLETFNLYCFLGTNYFVTVHSLPSHSVDVVRDRVERSPDLLSRGVERIAHGVIDTVVDEFLPLVDEVDDMVTRLEERLFENYDEKAIVEIFQVKRLVVQLRRYLGPLREVLNILTNRPHACINSAAQVYFRDVYDHTIRIVESLESVRDLVSTVLDTYLTQSSNRLNKVMKSLSVVGTISLPLVVVGGMFGMNLHGIPFAASVWGFAYGVALQIVLALAVYWYIRRRGWT